VPSHSPFLFSASSYVWSMKCTHIINVQHTNTNHYSALFDEVIEGQNKFIFIIHSNNERREREKKTLPNIFVQSSLYNNKVHSIFKIKSIILFIFIQQAHTRRKKEISIDTIFFLVIYKPLMSGKTCVY